MTPAAELIRIKFTPASDDMEALFRHEPFNRSEDRNRCSR